MVPTHCEICSRTLANSGTAFDAKTAFGPWAWMCSACFNEHRGQLGTGKGQRYTLTAGKWVKTAG